jgi:hypothetical protein
VIGRQAGLWMLLLVLANLSLILFWTQVVRPDQIGTLAGILGPLAGLVGAVTDGALASLVFLLNAGALVLWECGAQRGVSWMHGRTFPRVVASGALIVVVMGTLFYIFDAHFGPRDAWIVLSGPIAYAAFAVMSLLYYQRRMPDLYILTVTLLGGIMVVTALFGRLIGGIGIGTALLLAVLVIALTAGAAYWLRRVAQQQEVL